MHNIEFCRIDSSGKLVYWKLEWWWYWRHQFQGTTCFTFIIPGRAGSSVLRTCSANATHVHRPSTTLCNPDQYGNERCFKKCGLLEYLVILWPCLTQYHSFNRMCCRRERLTWRLQKQTQQNRVHTLCNVLLFWIWHGSVITNYVFILLGLYIHALISTAEPLKLEHGCIITTHIM